MINRLDRKDFAEIDGVKGCGEVRFIYRLAYAFKKKGRLLASRLPVDFNAVYSVAPDADGGCTGVAGRWRPQLDDAVDAGWLAGGPIDPSDLTFKQLELNAQVVRFPSGQETEFGGQAAYLMRIFGIDGDVVTEKGLENTPDNARLAADAALKARLVDYVKGNAAGHRPRRLRNSRRVPGEEDHLLVDIRQHTPRQPSVRRGAFRRTILPASTLRRCGWSSRRTR